LSAEAFLGGLNSLLPGDIVIKDCLLTDDDFHSRYSAKRKSYLYRILNRKLPDAVGRQYAWWVRRPLDVEAMRSALQHLTGTYDFSAFEAAGSPRSHSTRTVTGASLNAKDEGKIDFRICANGFLRYMVRNIIGTLVDVGLGKREPDDVKRTRQSGDRDQAGATAPPHGLFLVCVEF